MCGMMAESGAKQMGKCEACSTSWKDWGRKKRVGNHKTLVESSAGLKTVT